MTTPFSNPYNSAKTEAVPGRRPIDPATIYKPVLKVMGLGGGGCNAVERMIELGLPGIEFIAANTDKQALERNLAPVKIHLGPKTTRGLGAGGDPRIGQAAAEESCRQIAAALQGADMVFLTAGMGGGTGTGSIPVAAEIARSVGAVTIAIVTTPFSFEMGRRQRNASDGLEHLRRQTNTLIAIPNDRLLYFAPRNVSIETAFRIADDVLRQAVEGIAELITQPGLINVDFAHIRRLIKLGGGALMSIGHGEGEGKVQQAVERALHHPLLESVSLSRAAGVIANFTGGDDLSLSEVEEALFQLQVQTGGQTEIVMGVNCSDQMDNRAQVILVITGLGSPTLEETMASIQKIEHEPSAAPVITENAVPKTAPEAIVPIIEEEPEIQTEPTTIHPIEPSDFTPIISRSAQHPPLPRVTFSNVSDLASQNLDMPAFLRRRARLAGA